MPTDVSSPNSATGPAMSAHGVELDGPTNRSCRPGASERAHAELGPRSCRNTASSNWPPAHANGEYVRVPTSGKNTWILSPAAGTAALRTVTWTNAPSVVAATTWPSRMSRSPIQLPRKRDFRFATPAPYRAHWTRNTECVLTPNRVRYGDGEQVRQPVARDHVDRVDRRRARRRLAHLVGRAVARSDLAWRSLAARDVAARRDRRDVALVHVRRDLQVRRRARGARGRSAVVSIRTPRRAERGGRHVHRRSDSRARLRPSPRRLGDHRG